MGSGGGTVRLLLLQPQWQGWLKTSAHGAALINCSMTCIYASTYDMTIFIDTHILTYIHTCRGAVGSGFASLEGLKLGGSGSQADTFSQKDLAQHVRQIARPFCWRHRWKPRVLACWGVDGPLRLQIFTVSLWGFRAISGTWDPCLFLAAPS